MYTYMQKPVTSYSYILWHILISLSCAPLNNYFPMISYLISDALKLLTFVTFKDNCCILDN